MMAGNAPERENEMKNSIFCGSQDEVLSEMGTEQIWKATRASLERHSQAQKDSRIGEFFFLCPGKSLFKGCS